jgi:hypothetical protein
MFLFALDRNELTNALPRIPTPAGSVRPRAKTTSTAGQGAADADGVRWVVVAGTTSRALVTSATTTPAMRWRRITETMLADGIDVSAG